MFTQTSFHLHDDDQPRVQHDDCYRNEDGTYTLSLHLNYHADISIFGPLEKLEGFIERARAAIRDAKATTTLEEAATAELERLRACVVALDAREPGWTPPTREPNDTPTPVVRPLEGLHDPNVCQCDLCKAIMLAPF